MTTNPGDLLSDPLLTDVPSMDGFKVLEPCVLYSKLGAGGMGTVYRGRHLNLDIDVAVKCLKRSLAEEDADLIIRFQREARVAAGISSENLVRVFDVSKRHGVHFLVMELVRGETARERVNRKGALSPQEAATIALGAARGLAAAHAREIVHRDVKPDNILISCEGEVKVADLGLARAAQALDSLKTATRIVMGTPQYMPPEQFHSAASVGPPADVWALGATLTFLLTGEDGIPAGTLPEVMFRVVQDGFPDLAATRSDLPAELAAIVAKATDQDAAVRYADAAGFAADLEKFLGARGGAPPLDDPESGAGPLGGTVSPPPAETLARIKIAIEDGEAMTTPRAAPAETVPSTPTPRPHEPESARPRSRPPTVVTRRSRAWPIVLVLVVVVAAAALLAREFMNRGDVEPGPQSPEVGGTDPSEQGEPKGGGSEEKPDEGKPDDEESGGGDRTERVEVDPAEKLKQRVDEAAARAREAATLDEGLSLLEAVLVDHPGHPEATAILADAYQAKAQSLRDRQKLADALGACRRSLELAATPGRRALEGQLVDAVRAALSAAIVLESPEKDAVLEEGKVLFDGRIDYSGEVELSLDGAQVAVTGGRFLVERADIEEGRRTFVLELRDPSGVSARRDVSIAVDTRPPAITVTEPAAASWTRGPAVVVKGTVEDSTLASFEVGGVSVVVSSDGAFSHEVKTESSAEPVSIRLVAVDRAGRRTTVDHQVRVDATPPRLDLAGGGSVTNATSVRIAGTATDAESGVEAVEVVGVGVLPPLVDGKITWDFPLPSDGSHTCELVARDFAGNETKKTLRFIRDATPPTVQIERPPEGARLDAGPTTVVVTARDPLPVQVTVDGMAVTGRGGKFSASLRLDREGPRSITVVARDSAGNESRAVRNVTVARRVVIPSWARAKGNVAADPASGYAREVVHPETGIVLILVPAGSYKRGAPRSDPWVYEGEQPQHVVNITRPFYLGKFEVTNEQYRRFRPRHSTGDYKGAELDGNEQPVADVTWHDAKAYCDRYGFRLPTDAEWEYAARAGVTTRYPWGDQPTGGAGWASLLGPSTMRRFDFDSSFDFEDGIDSSASVGRFRANAFGLHDMTGNVWEWVADWHSATQFRQYGDGVSDPKGPSRGKRKILRGGAWNDGPRICRLSNRRSFDPDETRNRFGFRVTRDP